MQYATQAEVSGAKAGVIAAEDNSDGAVGVAPLARPVYMLVWALDRLSREGPSATLDIVHRLGQTGVQVGSYQEPWTEAGGELLDLLLAIAGWVARMESNRRSERTKAGLQRAVNQGKRLGRPPGSKDKKMRSRRYLVHVIWVGVWHYPLLHSGQSARPICSPDTPRSWDKEEVGHTSRTCQGR